MFTTVHSCKHDAIVSCLQLCTVVNMMKWRHAPQMVLLIWIRICLNPDLYFRIRIRLNHDIFLDPYKHEPWYVPRSVEAWNLIYSQIRIRLNHDIFQDLYRLGPWLLYSHIWIRLNPNRFQDPDSFEPWYIPGNGFVWTLIYVFQDPDMNHRIVWYVSECSESSESTVIGIFPQEFQQ